MGEKASLYELIREHVERLRQCKRLLKQRYGYRLEYRIEIYDKDGNLVGGAETQKPWINQG